ncbi:MAG: MFS transporter [Fimbriimonadaceae bacterium]|nr:MFS transporter [Fimbriimonadaceae bacterium]
MAEHFFLSAYWLGTNFHWGALLFIMMPGQIERMDPDHRAESLGLITGLSAIVALVAPLFFGAMSDRCASKWGRRRPYMAVGIVVNVIGLLLMAAAFSSTKPIEASFPDSLFRNPGFMAYFAAYLVVQLGNNITSAAYMGVIPDLVPANQRGVASGWMALMSQLGTLFGAVGAGLLFGDLSPLAQFAVVSASLIIFGIITMAGTREVPLAEQPPKIHWGSYLRSLWIDPKVYPDYAWVWITRALVMLGFYAVLPFLNYYLVDIIGVNRDRVGTDAGILIALILIAASISGVIGGAMSDRIGRKQVVYISNAGIAVVALFFIAARDLNQAYLVGTIFGLFYGAYGAVDYALGTDVLPNKEDAGKDMAVWHVAMTLPQSIASPVAGALIAAYGATEFMYKGEKVVQYTHAGYSAVFVLCSVCFGLGAYLLRNVRGVR